MPLTKPVTVFTQNGEVLIESTTEPFSFDIVGGDYTFLAYTDKFDADKASTAEYQSQFAAPITGIGDEIKLDIPQTHISFDPNAPSFSLTFSNDTDPSINKRGVYIVLTKINDEGKVLYEQYFHTEDSLNAGDHYDLDFSNGNSKGSKIQDKANKKILENNTADYFDLKDKDHVYLTVTGYVGYKGDFDQSYMLPTVNLSSGDAKELATKTNAYRKEHRSEEFE